MGEVGNIFYITHFTSFGPLGENKAIQCTVKNEQVCFILTTLLHFMCILGHGKSYCFIKK